ncbi:MAG TPA: NrfD/PsrC family molybdoenzyme membrane anchor subunit [Terriglobales bacterium]|nr:NrfD/PsrC family molybdoenzyme membrane anchor subunit [Terriglobales bacterium]
MRALWIVLAVLGAAAFLWGLSADPRGAWSLYLVNLVFFSAIAATGPAIAAMMQLTEARWSPSVRRLALTTAGFLPVSFVLFMVLFLGREDLYSWVTKPVAVKAAWLNVPFFFGRTLVLAAALFLTAYAFIRRLLADPMPQEEERERTRRNRLATMLLFLWLITLSLWGYDLLMSLDPVWYSGLFGGYFVVSALYTTFATLSILSVSTNARGAASIPAAAIQDVAKLQFAMSVMWMYFFWSQYLVIWYGNVPIETRFFVRRFFVQPWQTLAWVVFFLGWLIPFAYLLKRLTGRPPSRHTPLVIAAVMGLVGIFLERVLVVFPSVSSANRLPLGVRDLLITAGFFALFVLSRRWFMGRFKPVLNLPHTGGH